MLYVPEATQNFLSTLRYMSNGYSTAAKGGMYKIFNPSDVKIMQGEIRGQMIIFNFEIRATTEQSNQIMSLEGDSWHCRFGHMCAKHTEKLADTTMGVPVIKVKADTTTCDVCAEAKFKKLKHNSL